MNAVRRLEERLKDETHCVHSEGIYQSEAVILVRGLRALKAGLRAAMEYQRTVGDKKQIESIEEDLVLLYRLEARYLQGVPEGMIAANDRALEEFLAKELNEETIEQFLVDVKKPGMTVKPTHVVKRKR